MTRKHNVSSIISDKLYCTIKEAIEFSFGFNVPYYSVKVDDKERIVTYQLPSSLQYEPSVDGDYLIDVDCYYEYFIPFCDNFRENWKDNPFKSMEFDEEALLLTLHFETDDIIEEIEKTMDYLADDEILIRIGGAWCISKFDDKEFNECYL